MSRKIRNVGAQERVVTYVMCEVFKHRHGVSSIYGRWSHSQGLPKSRPHLSYSHFNKVGHEFSFKSSQNSAPFEIKTQWNRITCMQLTSPKVPPSKTIHDGNTFIAPPPSEVFVWSDYCIFQQARLDDVYVGRFCLPSS